MSILEGKQCYVVKENNFIMKKGDSDENAVNEEFNYIEKVINQHTNDEEFIPLIKKLETNLPTSYIDIHTWFLFKIIYILYWHKFVQNEITHYNFYITKWLI